MLSGSSELEEVVLQLQCQAHISADARHFLALSHTKQACTPKQLVSAFKLGDEDTRYGSS